MREKQENTALEPLIGFGWNIGGCIKGFRPVFMLFFGNEGIFLFKKGVVNMAKRDFDDLIKGFLAGRDGLLTPFKTFHREIENRSGKKISGRGLGAILRRIFRESGGNDYLNSDKLKK